MHNVFFSNVFFNNEMIQIHSLYAFSSVSTKLVETTCSTILIISVIVLSYVEFQNRSKHKIY